MKILARRKLRNNFLNKNEKNIKHVSNSFERFFAEESTNSTTLYSGF